MSATPAVPPLPAPGAALPPLPKGRYTSSHLARWCAAQRNWDKIHYDLDYAQRVAGLRERVINGALKQHLLVQCLDEAFDALPWIRRIAFRFTGPDYVGERLEVRGTVRSVLNDAGRPRVVVDLSIHNLEQDRATTTGWALLEWPHGDRRDADPAALPPDFALDESVEPPSGPVPAAIAARVGAEDERIESAGPLDASRLRLFADAVGGLRPEHYDDAAGRAGRHGTVVAPPLFPIHGLEAHPGQWPLSEDPEALGREGVNEIGRNLSRRFGLPSRGIVNGGGDVEVFSLLRVGETVCAASTLAGASVKRSAQGGAMLLTTALNTYRTRDGRLLLKERQTTVHRHFETP